MITLNASPQVVRINPDFIGLSYEKSALSLRLFTDENHELVSLFKNLGGGVLRIGGNQVDRTNWNAHGPGHQSKSISPSDIDRLARFANLAGWTVIYGINLATNTPANAADEAAYVAKALGNQLAGFEIGNEPDLYHKNGLRDPSYDYENFKTEWETFASSIRSRINDVRFMGPAATTKATNYAVPFAKDEAGKFSLLTHHYYRANGQLPTSTIDLLLQPDPNLASILDVLKITSQSSAHPVPFRVAECNSFYNGGAPGVSNGFGTALWGIDFLFLNLEAGSSGVNFHGGGDGPGYTAIANDPSGQVDGVRPLYYAMFIFSKFAHGTLIPTTVAGDSSNVSTYAIKSDDGSYWILILNKDRTNSVDARVGLPSMLSKADVSPLEASSLDAISGYRFSGAPINFDGSWKGVPHQLAISNQSLTVNVIAGSLIAIHAR